jgi:hypothetical protein
MRGVVLNTFNIREVIELFNILYTGFFSRKNKPENDDDSNNDIDNYLDGKINNN